MSSLFDIYNYIDGFAPFSTQMDWDNSGIIVNCGNAEIKKVLVTLDVDKNVFSDAVSGGFDLIVSHHPIIFKAISALDSDTIAADCFKNNISVISAHTNYDFADCGVNEVLANKLDLENIRKSDCEFLKIGDLPNEMTSDDFASHVKERLNASIRYNIISKSIKKVAVCGGAGSEFFYDAKSIGADALVTGDAKYHEFLDAKSEDIMLVAAGHYETEFPAVYKLCDLLLSHFKDIKFEVSNQKTSVINI